MSTEPSTKKTYTFIYEGKNLRGETIKGELEASDVHAVKKFLRHEKIITKIIRKKGQALFQRKKKISTKDVTHFTRQLATMLTAGIPLVQSFDIVGKGHPNPSMTELVGKVKTTVEEGHTFAAALEHHPRQFNDLYCNLVATGEQSGALDKILGRLATYKEKTESIKSKIRKALIYPAAILVVAVAVTAAILVFVVPQFEDLFSNFGAELPFLTRQVIGLSEFIQYYWWILFFTLAALTTVSISSYRRSPTFKHSVQKALLKIPLFGTLVGKACVARFARTLATTFSAGIPIVDGLGSVASATGNIAFEKASYDIQHAISHGQALNVAVSKTGVFPEMVVQMIAIGEESGELEQMLNKIADYFEEEVDNMVDSLSTLIEPVLMAILGILVGGLIVAMYMPIFKLGSVV